MMWIVTANTNLCRIYEVDKKDMHVALLQEIFHPENRLRKGEYLTSDRPGHYASDSSTRGAFEQRTDQKTVAVDNFSREIAHELNKGRNGNAFQNLIIITPSQMNGMLTKHLDKHVRDMIAKEIHKDVMQLSHHELVEYLRELKDNHELQ